MRDHSEMLQVAERHLESACPHMRRLIRRSGPCGLTVRPDGFEMLVRSITSQQISAAASRAIVNRLASALAPAPICPGSVSDLGQQRLLQIGYSARKASYVLGLAQRVLEGETDLDALADMPDDEVTRSLIEVRGIGEWTAHMFLIFSLGRPDVLPWGDLGVRQALQRFHGLDAPPGKRESLELAQPWRPYASVASWYCWRSVDERTGRAKR